MNKSNIIKRLLFPPIIPILICFVIAFAVFRLISKPDIPLHFWDASFSPDGSTLVTVGGQNAPGDRPRIGELIFWDTFTGKRQKFIPERSSVRSVAWSPDGKFIVMGEFGGSSDIIAPDSGKSVADLPPHLGGVNAVAISSDSKLIAIGGLDGVATLCDNTGKQVDAFILPDPRIISITISSDGTKVAAGTSKGKAYLYDLAKRTDPVVLEAIPSLQATADASAETNVDTAPEATTNTVADTVTSAGSGTATNAGAGTATKADPQTTIETAQAGTPKKQKKKKAKKKGDQGRSTVEAIAFSPEGHILMTGCKESLVLWDTSTCKLLRKLGNVASPVNGAAFSPNGAILATVHGDGTLVLWNPITGDRLKSKLAHQGPACAVKFSKDGKHIATVGRNDFTVKIWDPETLALVATLQRLN